MDGYFGHLTKKIPKHNSIFYSLPSVLPLSRSTSLFLLSPLTVMEIQDACFRRARDENSSIHICGLQEEQQKDIKLSTEAMWPIFNLRHSLFTTDNLVRAKRGQ